MNNENLIEFSTKNKLNYSYTEITIQNSKNGKYDLIIKRGNKIEIYEDYENIK